MDLDKANKTIDEMLDDTVYCKIKLNTYNKAISVEMSGLFSPDELVKIGEIVNMVEIYY
jgi:hypothetical protein